MPRRARQLAESGIYHVMLRGVNRDALFLETGDYERFLQTLRVATEASGCHVLAYCLMTNHVHLVLRTTQEPISAVIKRLGVSYSGWFNRKYGRVGHLFQDRFRSQAVEDDSYFVTLLRYVWNNPVEAGLVDRPEKYPWSSHRHLGHASSIVNETALRRLLPSGHLEEEMEGHAPLPSDWSVSPIQPTRHSDVDVSELVRRACGAAGAADFADLVPARKLDVIRDLRTRSVSYAQIARATGMSISSVRRAHVSGRFGSALDVA
jgi:REP element-mobilizing transposase RayT